MTIAELDTQVPNGARAYDYLLGGRAEYLACDRQVVEAVTAAWPPGAPGPLDLALANRAYLSRAVTAGVHSWARQVLDLGAGYLVPRLQVPGMPAVRPLHEDAQAAHPDARFAYADQDTCVAWHGRKALADAGARGVVYAQADLSDPAQVAACEDVAAVIDWGQPVLVILGLVLHYWPPDAAREIVQGYLCRLVPGSRVVITVPHWRDPALYERVRAAYAPREVHNHTETEVMALFRGTQLLGNGVEQAVGRPGIAGREDPACILAGTGLV
jgi:hypothetical protein